MRLDRFLVEQGMVQSRTKAQTLIEEGMVVVDEKRALKASMDVTQEQEIRLIEPMRYVGRAAKKLEAFLKSYPVAIEGRRCLDVGASTGGFTQVLLERGARSVVALDVGKAQLHEDLRKDPRVVVREGTDIRRFESQKRFEVTTCDVSFISLEHIVEALDRVSLGVLVLLFKPQFEVGKEAKRDRHGVVKDERAIAEAMRRFEKRAQELGWRLMVRAPSQIAGKEGNREWFYCYRNR